MVSDDALGMRFMVEHLAGLGHRRITYLGGPLELSTGALRQRAFKEAMRAAKLDVEEQLSPTAKAYSVSEGLRLARQLPRQQPRPTAILTANDMLALGAYEAAGEAELEIPADISITGFNDTPFVDRLTPPLTTIRIQHYEMGAQAASLLLQQLVQPQSPGMTIHLGVELVVRSSTAAPPTRRTRAA